MKFKITDVNEKDIDLLLAEEFASSASFVSLFLNRIAGFSDHDLTVEKVYRSHTDTYGESDLEIYLVNSDGLRVILLIENKITAQFQVNQLQRYIKRGKSYLQQDKCDTFKLVLVAPQDYIDDFDALDVDGVVFYEELRAWLGNSSMQPGRLHYKVTLIDRALEKAKYGYQLIEDEHASNFWKDYWKQVNIIAPVLNMPEPGKKPTGSSFIYFYPPDLPNNISLIHKFTYGNIDIQIQGAGKKKGVIRSLFAGRIPNDYSIKKAGKSAVIRTSVPVLDINKSVSSQSDLIHTCIQQVESSYDWFSKNADEIQTLLQRKDD